MSEPTPSELGRRLDDIKTDVRHIAIRLDTVPDQGDLQNVASVWLATLESSITRVDSGVAENRRRVEAVEAWQTWALRLTTGGILTAALAALITWGGGKW